MPLAKMAVEKTGRGVYEDKCTKKIYATEYIWHSIKKDKNVGITMKNHMKKSLKLLNQWVELLEW